MLEEYIETLKKGSLFSGIDTSDISLMLDCLKPKTCAYRKDDYIVSDGEKLEAMGIILEGEALVIKENAAGNRVVMTLLHPGDMFGEMLVFSSTAIWPASVVAQKDARVMFLQRKKITGQCGKACYWHNSIIENMLKIISERALVLNKKVEYLTIKSMRGKIAAFFLEQYKKAGSRIFEIRMNRNDLADFLNVSRPSMSREMSRMRDEGVIDFHLSTIKILDLETLKGMCEL